MNIWHLITFRIQLLFTPSVHFLGHHPIGGCDVHAGVRAEDSGKSEGEGEGEGRTVTNGPRHRHFRHLSPPGDIGDVIIFSPHTITRRLAVRDGATLPKGHERYGRVEELPESRRV